MITSSQVRPPICLAMIVKNEEQIIERCLNKVRRFIDHWIIVDTGSTDNTKEKILRSMSDLPGELHERSWNGFGPAKTQALELARSHMNAQGYALVVDADEIIEGEMPVQLDCDSYGIWMLLNNLRYKNVRLFRLDKPWRFVGVLHEYPICSEAKTEGMTELTFTTPRDGARAQNPNTYREDAEALEAELARSTAANEPPDPRTVFYLAQSWRDARNDQKASVYYLQRASMIGWWEETYIAWLEAGRALDRLGRLHEADRAFLSAHHQYAERAEALRSLDERFEKRRSTAEVAAPVGTLFVEMGERAPRKKNNGFDYKHYWNEVYAEGGNSGAGSYGVLSEYKSEVINRFITEHSVHNITEFGCGDGHQLGLFRCPSYVGLDVAASAVESCSKKYAKDPTKSFFLYDPRSFTDNAKRFYSELVLSLDVLYHITDDEDFERSIAHIFESSERYVILYTKITSEEEPQVVQTIRDRDVLKKIPSNFKIIERPIHPHPHLSSASFILLERNPL